VSGGVTPDLRYLRPEARAAFEDIVLRGSLAGAGMPSRARYLDAEGARTILLYLAERAHAAPPPAPR
jgi:hypothetical protein